MRAGSRASMAEAWAEVSSPADWALATASSAALVRADSTAAALEPLAEAT